MGQVLVLAGLSISSESRMWQAQWFSVFSFQFSVFGYRLPAMSRDVGVGGVVNGA
jgi:hypothetical protein